MTTDFPGSVCNNAGCPNDAIFFDYDETHTRLLKDAEPLFADSIDSIGHIYRKIYPDPFHGLVHCILGQQVSAKAHATLWQRFMDRYGTMTPDALAGQTPDELRKLGISARKGSYIINIAQEFASGSLCGAALRAMESAALAERLLKIPGIGYWTVEMLEIFTFQRMNVLSYNDLAIRKGLGRLYGIKNISRIHFKECVRKFSPVGSVASLYLWELAKSPGQTAAQPRTPRTPQ